MARADVLSHIRSNLLPLIQSTHGSMWFYGKGARLKKYIFSLDDDDLQYIRWHASFFGGVGPDHYYGRQAPHEVDEYRALTAGLPESLWISEPVVSGVTHQFGNDDGHGRIVNQDINRFQECIANLHLVGALDWLKRLGRRPIICEIGSGFGGFALHLSRILPESLIVLIDLPQSLFMAGAYLAQNVDKTPVVVFEPGKPVPESGLLLVPAQSYAELPIAKIDTFFNMLSMQEMPDDAVRAYLDFMDQRSVGFFYSSNWPRHELNPALPKSIDELLWERCRVTPQQAIYENWRNRKIFAPGSCVERIFLAAPKSAGTSQSLNGVMRAARGRASIPVELHF